MEKRNVTAQEVWKARKRIEGLVKKTPLIYSSALSDKVKTDVYLKLENLQTTGSFKIRGAVNRILSLSEKELANGVATFSTGNHGIAVAHVAKELGVPATICVSNRVPKAKINKLKKLRANIKVVGNSQDAAAAYCEKLEKEDGIITIKPFDDPDIISGQATIGLEIMEDCPNIDSVVIPLSGGGLLAGISFFLKYSNPGVHVVGASIERSAVMHHSLKAGKPILLEEKKTLADSLLGGIGLNNAYTFPMTKKYMDTSLLVSESEIADGVRFMMDEHKMILEGAAATGVGLIYNNRVTCKGPIVIIVSGNNIDYELVRQLVKQ